MSSISAISSDLGLVQVAATFIEVLAFVVGFAWLAQLFIIVVSNKSDADPTGSRPMAAYLFSGAYLTLWVAFIGVDVAANSLIQLIGGHPAGQFSFEPTTNYKDNAIRACVLGGLLLVFAGGAFVAHLRRGTALVDEDDRSGPTRKVMRGYVALVSYMSMTISVLAFVVAGWLVAGLISPSVFLANASRTSIARALLDAIVVVVLAGGIFLYHQAMAPTQLRLLSSHARSSHPIVHAHDGVAAAAPHAVDDVPPASPPPLP